MRYAVHDVPPRRRHRRLGRLGLTLGLVALLGLVLAPSAFAGFITPKSGGSPNADSISSLYKVVLYIAAVVFVIVEGALLYSIIRFRAKKGRSRPRSTETPGWRSAGPSRPR